MGAMVVAVVKPAIPPGLALLGVMVSKTVRPFAQGALDEALGLAMGLWAIGTGELVTDAQALAGRAEVPRTKGAAVVGQETTHRDAQAGVVGYGVLQESHGARGALVGLHPAEGHARVVVDRHEQELPAGAGDTVATVAGYPMAHAFNTAEFLDVNVQEVARGGVLVTLDRPHRLEVALFGQPLPRQDPAHGALGEAQGGGDAGRGQPAAPHFNDRRRLGRGHRSRAGPWPGTGVGQRGRVSRPVAGEPLASRRFTYPGGGRGRRRGELRFDHRAHHLPATCKRKSGILTVVHSAGLLGTGCLTTSSISGPVRMNLHNNLLKHYT